MPDPPITPRTALAISHYFPPALPVSLPPRRRRFCVILEHDPEKWEPVFRKDHAQTKG
jgi:hypothetical protein